MALEHLDQAGNDTIMKAGDLMANVIGDGTSGKGIAGGLFAKLDELTARARGSATEGIINIAGGISNGLDKITSAPGNFKSGVSNMLSKSSPEISAPGKVLGMEQEGVVAQGAATKHEFSSLDSQLKTAGISKDVGAIDFQTASAADNFSCSTSMPCNINHDMQIRGA